MRPERRQRMYRIPGEYIGALVMCGARLENRDERGIEWGAPPDARYLGARWDMLTDSLEVLLWHESFDVLAEGEAAPVQLVHPRVTLPPAAVHGGRAVTLRELVDGSLANERDERAEGGRP